MTKANAKRMHKSTAKPAPAPPHEDDKARARDQAHMQYESIADFVQRLTAAEQREQAHVTTEAENADDVRQLMQESPLSVQVRGGWYQPGGDKGDADEYEILLCTGGPAVRILGELDQGSPSSARLQYQDWFTPWMDWSPAPESPVTHDVMNETLLAYASTFYFSD